MTFAGINYLAVLLAAAAAWVAGAVWYVALATPWMAAVGISQEKIAASKTQPGATLPFIFAFAGCGIMAWVLAGIVGHLGQVTLRNGVISALFCWVGFVITTMLVNNSFAMRSRMLLLIDGGYWLVALTLMGAIIGTMGV
jgi:ABC-type molybdate transport system permease subunit